MVPENKKNKKKKLLAWKALLHELKNKYKTENPNHWFYFQKQTPTFQGILIGNTD